MHSLHSLNAMDWRRCSGFDTLCHVSVALLCRMRRRFEETYMTEPGSSRDRGSEQGSVARGLPGAEAAASHKAASHDGGALPGISSEVLFKAVYDQASHFAGILELDGRLRHANRMACAFIGRDAASLEGQLFWDTPWWNHSPEAQEALKDAIRRAGQGDTVRFKTTHVDVEGVVHNVIVTERPVRDQDGTIFCLISEGYDITEHERDEAALRFTQYTVDHAAEGVIWTDETGRFIYLNETACHMFDASREELLGLSVSDVDPNIPRDLWPERWRILKERGSVTVELAAKRKDGTALPVEIVAKYVTSAGREFNCSFLRDISERKRAEEELRNSVSALQSVFRAAPVAITFSANRILTSVNEATCRITGYTEEELLGQSARLFYFTDEEFEAVGKALYGSVATQDWASVEARFRRKDGAAIQVALSRAYLRADDPSEGFVIVFQDITARKHAEEALRDSEARFRALISNSRDLISVVGADGVGMYESPALLHMFGREPESLIGVDTFSLIHQDDVAFVRESFVRLIREGGSVTTPVEYRYRHADGSWVYVEAVGSNHLDDPAIRGIVVNSRDITERKRTEEDKSKLQDQLQQAMKMEAVGRLAGGVAHDFNNLLTTIIGNVELAKAEIDAPDRVTQHLDEVNRAAESAASLTRQLLAFSRRQIIEPTVLNLNELIENLHKMLARLIGEDIALEHVLAKALGAVKVDQGQFEQVLVNLAINARDAMPDGGRLMIETQNIDLDENYCVTHPHVQPGRYVLLVISDTGHGMTEEVKEHLFEPFFTTKAKGHGTGLGLATTFGAVKQSGGSIEVYSEVGKGSSFKIYLPRVELKTGRLGGSKPGLEVPRGTETILLVEDENSVRDLAQRILGLLGYTVMQAPSGDAAITIAEQFTEPIHLLMTDVIMPGMNGRELAERLVRLHPEAKVLFTSGYTENVIAHHGVIDEGVNFIGKPYSIRPLARKIRQVLAQDL